MSWQGFALFGWQHAPKPGQMPAVPQLVPSPAYTRLLVQLAFVTVVQSPAVVPQHAPLGIFALQAPAGQSVRDPSNEPPEAAQAADVNLSHEPTASAKQQRPMLQVNWMHCAFATKAPDTDESAPNAESQVVLIVFTHVPSGRQHDPAFATWQKSHVPPPEQSGPCCGSKLHTLPSLVPPIQVGNGQSVASPLKTAPTSPLGVRFGGGPNAKQASRVELGMHV